MRRSTEKDFSLRISCKDAVDLTTVIASESVAQGPDICPRRLLGRLKTDARTARNLDSVDVDP